MSCGLKASLHVLRFKDRCMFEVNWWNIIAREFSVIQKLKGSYLLLLWISRSILIGWWLSIGSWKTSNVIPNTSLALQINLVSVSVYLLLLELLRNMVSKLCWLLIIWVHTWTHSFVLLVHLVTRLKRFSQWVTCVSNVCVTLILLSLS